MVKYVTLWVSLFCFLFIKANAATLSLELNKQQVEMGKFIIATFTYIGSPNPGELDLELWQKNFYLRTDDAEQSILSNGETQTQYRIRLYPREVGKFSLDAIAHAGSFVEPQLVIVEPSIRNSVDATPIIHPLKTDYWADEPILITVDVALHDPQNEVSAKEWDIESFTLTALPTEQIILNKQPFTRLKWMIYSPNKGSYKLDLPAIVQRGRGRFLFHSKPLVFTIKPLPAYLPASIASGQLSISSQIVRNGQQNVLHVFIKKQGFLPKQLEGLQAFINALSDDEIALNIQQSEKRNEGVTTRQYSMNLPQWVLAQIPTLKISYFNHETAMLETINHPFPTIWLIPKPFQWLALYFALFIILILLNVLDKKAAHWRAKTQYQQQIKRAKTPQKLRLIILNSRYKTLQEWAKKQNKLPSNDIALSLNETCFGRQTQERNQQKLDQIKQLLLKQ